MPASPALERVKKVIDGDTFTTFDHEDPVRLENFNAPEINTRKGKAAKAVLLALIKGKTVSIGFKAYDDYARRVSQVKINGRSVNKAMADWLQRQGKSAAKP